MFNTSMMRHIIQHHLDIQQNEQLLQAFKKTGMDDDEIKEWEQFCCHVLECLEEE